MVPELLNNDAQFEITLSEIIPIDASVNKKVPFTSDRLQVEMKNAMCRLALYRYTNFSYLLAVKEDRNVAWAQLELSQRPLVC